MKKKVVATMITREEIITRISGKKGSGIEDGGQAITSRATVGGGQEQGEIFQTSRGKNLTKRRVLGEGDMAGEAQVNKIKVFQQGVGWDK